ncbi:MAG: metalloregulator ArsR/SmtB family transcription factor [Bacteroidota bacterium]
MTTSPPDQLAALSKALAHPARLAILQTLGARGTCVCGEVVEVVGLAQSTVSQHLKVLREAGLVRGTAEGRHSCFCLDGDALSALSRELAAFVDGLSACTCEDDGCDCC